MSSSADAPNHAIAVAVQTPAHSGMGDLLTYRNAQPLAAGTLVSVLDAFAAGFN